MTNFWRASSIDRIVSVYTEKEAFDGGGSIEPQAHCYGVAIDKGRIVRHGETQDGRENSNDPAVRQVFNDG